MIVYVALYLAALASTIALALTRNEHCPHLTHKRLQQDDRVFRLPLGAYTSERVRPWAKPDRPIPNRPSQPFAPPPGPPPWVDFESDEALRRERARLDAELADLDRRKLEADQRLEAALAERNELAYISDVIDECAELDRDEVEAKVTAAFRRVAKARRTRSYAAVPRDTTPKTTAALVHHTGVVGRCRCARNEHGAPRCMLFEGHTGGHIYDPRGIEDPREFPIPGETFRGEQHRRD